MFSQLIPAVISRIPLDAFGATQPHLYWRIFCLENFIYTNGGDDSYSATEIQFRQDMGGPNVAVGGTPTANTTYPGYPITQAFDGNNSSLWSGDNFYTASRTGWVSYQFTSPVVINEIMWRSRQDGYANQSVREGRLEYSDNGAAWRPAWSFSNTNPYGLGESRVFTNPRLVS